MFCVKLPQNQEVPHPLEKTREKYLQITQGLVLGKLRLLYLSSNSIPKPQK